MLVLGKSVFPQSYDSLCSVPVMMIEALKKNLIIVYW